SSSSKLAARRCEAGDGAEAAMLLKVGGQRWTAGSFGKTFFMDFAFGSRGFVSNSSLETLRLGEDMDNLVDCPFGMRRREEDLDRDSVRRCTWAGAEFLDDCRSRLARIAKSSRLDPFELVDRDKERWRMGTLLVLAAESGISPASCCSCC
ncbi:MAG: hypothetical protein SGARI_007539, partial [Bacillariaceae sp.]